jgi:hypothetical protein
MKIWTERQTNCQFGEEKYKQWCTRNEKKSMPHGSIKLDKNEQSYRYD